MKKNIICLSTLFLISIAIFSNTWIVKETVDLLSDSKIVEFVTHPVKQSYFVPYETSLIIQADLKKKTIDIFVNFNVFLAKNDINILYKFDNSEIKEEFWRHGDNYSVAKLPNEASKVLFIQKMINSNTFSIRGKSHFNETFDLYFNINKNELNQKIRDYRINDLINEITLNNSSTH